MRTVTVELDEDVFGLLQSQAKPFTDTPSSVIRRMWKELKETRSTTAGREPVSPPAVLSDKTPGGVYITTRGVEIPFGELRAVYKRRGSPESKAFKAIVTEKGIEFEGKIFDDPSPAGIYAKHLAGAKGTATSTNGWEFWEYFNAEKNQWMMIGELRSTNPSKLTLIDLGL